MLAVRLAALALAVAALVTGIAGGLLRAGWNVPAATVAGQHALLLISGFLGTVISLERAIALGRPAAFAAPVLAAIGTALLLTGSLALALASWCAASVALLLASIAIVGRQSAPHTWMLLFAAALWVAAALRALAVGIDDATIVWGFLFLVLTIAAERLELTRLMRRRRSALPLLGAITGLLVVAGLAIPLAREIALRAFGTGLCALAIWLAVFDLARCTIRTEGFARYAAFALLGGYAWLFVAGCAWIALSAGVTAARDAALHALALGFVVTMIFAHAPIVVPVIARTRLAYRPAFYVPVVLLHASLLVRLVPVDASVGLRAIGAAGNAFAIAVFAVTLVTSLVAARRRGGS